MVLKIQGSRGFDSVAQSSDNPAQKTTQGFEKVTASIKNWVPRRRRNTEEGYKIDLRNHLEDECKLSVKEEAGETKTDLLVNNKFPVELKKAPDLAEYDRLFGQLARHALAHGTAIAVICDIKRQDEFDEFIERTKKIFDCLRLRVVLISK